MTYRVCVIKYGYANIEAKNADEALEIARNEDDSSFDWSEFGEEEIMEEYEDEDEDRFYKDLLMEQQEQM